MCFNAVWLSHCMVGWSNAVFLLLVEHGTRRWEKVPLSTAFWKGFAWPPVILLVLPISTHRRSHNTLRSPTHVTANAWKVSPWVTASNMDGGWSGFLLIALADPLRSIEHSSHVYLRIVPHKQVYVVLNQANALHDTFPIYSRELAQPPSRCADTIFNTVNLRPVDVDKE